MSVTAARGFEAAGVAAQIRKSSLDVALVRSTVPARGGGMFTANRVKAAPVLLCQEALGLAQPQAVVINSGIANAATGAEGDDNARATQAHTAAALGIDADQVLVLSTGVIGIQLPLARLLAGVDAAAAELAADGGAAAAEAILTTDTGPKTAAVSTGGFTVGGMAKGAGMIHPCLATMLAIVTTDYPLDDGEPLAFLKPAVRASFNRISVDGECSTNDAVLLLANGASGVERTAATDAAFADALAQVCADLSRQIVSDGEGATVVLEIDVAGAANDDEATAIARRIATSPLVKTAAFGRDPNWGRVLAAAGSAPFNGGFAQLDPNLLSVAFNGMTVFADGGPLGVTPDLAGPSCKIELDVGIGGGRASYLASDLTYEYVRVNAEYTT
jgi:glutamate N-acetyltransferase/amino-acid N-acetyltransferase